jgi:prevent-host-death family protein
MRTVNMLDAKTQLSRLVEAVESGTESAIMIARNGRPAAKLVPAGEAPPSAQRLGIADGKYPRVSLEDFDADNEVIGALFVAHD